MRVSYSYAVRDQNRLVYQRDEDFIASLASELRGPTQRWFERFQLTLDDDIALFEGLYSRYRDNRRVKVQLAPANLHWCSDEALRRLADCSRKYHVPLHMHLLETTTIGIDEAGINDDRDMLQEMRMVLRAHRVPGMDDGVPTPAPVFRMATSGGAKTIPFADTIGALEVGRADDIVLIDWRAISYPYLDAETPLLDAILQRAKTSGVHTVICDGEVIYHDGQFIRIDRDATLLALHEDLQRALSDGEVERRHLSKSLLRHVRGFYVNYFDPEQHAPFYQQSSRQ